MPNSGTKKRVETLTIIIINAYTRQATIIQVGDICLNLATVSTSINSKSGY